VELATNNWGGKTALPDWESIALAGRDLYIVFDSDVTLKTTVFTALSRLKAFLVQRGGNVMVIYLPPGDHGQKVGLDDYLASGHTTQELLALASAELLSPADDHQDAITPYQETERGLVFMKSTRDGTVSVPLTNFNAKIVSHLIEDDGVESRGLLEIEASLNEKRMRCMVSPARFNAMTWPLEQIGPEAVVYSGFGAKDHARVAIQVLSGLVTKRRVYTHTGWRERDGEWVYLHGGGAIGSIGTILGMEVQLPAALAGVVLPEPPARDERVAVIRSSLNFLGLAPMRVTIPMYTAIARSLLPDVDFSVNLVGATGTGKTALAALVQQHFGTAIGARRLPAAWSSTPNALEDLAFQAKDMVLTIDDFIPTGSNGDVQRMHAAADRVLRGQGNRSGRQRMHADGRLRSPRPPRGLILSTGEELPRGQSLRARFCIVEVAPSDVNWNSMTLCQRDAASGIYAEALAGFIHWIAPQYGHWRDKIRDEVEVWRAKAVKATAHARTPEIVANLAVGFRLWLDYAKDAGAVTGAEAEAMFCDGWQALGEVAVNQTQHQTSSEPTSRFLALLGGALASGRAHLAPARDGSSGAAWAGWRTAPAGRLEPHGERIGWFDGNDVYLLTDVAHAVAQDLARDGDDGTLPGSKTLHKRMYEKKLLASTDPDRGRLTIRRTLDNCRRDVLHIRAASLGVGESPQSTRSSPGDVSDCAADGEELDGTYMRSAS
jgi:uncharacterized protein DUF3854/uncharacterized protein DUF927